LFLRREEEGGRKNEEGGGRRKEEGRSTWDKERGIFSSSKLRTTIAYCGSKLAGPEIVPRRTIKLQNARARNDNVKPELPEFPEFPEFPKQEGMYAWR
jgi:hypothetical protein